MNASRFTTGASLLPLVTLLRTVQPAWPETAMAPSHSQQLVITSVEPWLDDPQPQLFINGWNFGTSNGDVFLQDDPLQVDSWTDSEIVVNLPNGLSAATYLLTVRNGGGATKHDTFPVTIGAMGPAGPPGLGISGYEVIRSQRTFNFLDPDRFEVTSLSASCSAGAKLLLGVA